jgi:hypothetical protein
MVVFPSWSFHKVLILFCHNSGSIQPFFPWIMANIYIYIYIYLLYIYIYLLYIYIYYIYILYTHPIFLYIFHTSRHIQLHESLVKSLLGPVIPDPKHLHFSLGCTGKTMGSNPQHWKWDKTRQKITRLGPGMVAKLVQITRSILWFWSIAIIFTVILSMYPLVIKPG